VTLFIKDLVSIGAVPAGDNPTADIVIWKKAPASKSLPGSMDERLDAIRNAWREAHPYIPNGPDSWVEAIYSTYLIVSENEKKFRVPYSESEGSFQFGAMTPVELRVTIVDKSRDTAPKTKGNINVEGFTLDDLPDEYRAGVESLIAAAATPEPLDEAEIEKAAETQALIAKLQDENAETRKALADEIAKRRHAELVAKAQADGLSEILPVGELADAFAELSTPRHPSRSPPCTRRSRRPRRRSQPRRRHSAGNSVRTRVSRTPPSWRRLMWRSSRRRVTSGAQRRFVRSSGGPTPS